MPEPRDRDRSDGSADLRIPWSRSKRSLPRLLIQPLQQFIQTEASGGLVLLAAAVAALLWANLAGDSYESVWHTRVTIGVGRWAISEDLRHWINDGGMTLFFFVVGLEIKREFVAGELRDPRAAALPLAAAIGGMVVPALIFLSVNAGSVSARGWGIPMATDIAFALGVLAIAGRGLPSGVRLFLLTLAIVDDVGAILVIAIFYSGQISFVPLITALGLLAMMVLLRRIQVRAGAVYAVVGIGVWLATFESGIHATIAGVALAFVTPASAFQRSRAVSEEARRVADETSDDPAPPDVDTPQWLHLARLSREAVSPLARLGQALHPWTSFVIVPLFALANAGVEIGGQRLNEGVSMRLAIGIVAGLVVGKVAGIMLGSVLAVRFAGSRLPPGIGWTHLLGVAALGGIGFTVSLFIAGLAFTDESLLDTAKLSILAASVISGVLGSALLVRRGRDAERSGSGLAL